MTKLQSTEEIEPIIAMSHTRPVMIFKHSLTCPISTAAHEELESFLAGRPDDDGVSYFLVEIQHARPVSTAIAERTGVRHESPQALLLRSGEVVWHGSHSGIRRETLQRALAA